MSAIGGRPRREDGRNSNTVAITKYSTSNYDRINIYIKKGEKEKLQREAKKAGLSVNTYMNKIISDNISDFEPLNQENSKGFKKEVTQ